MRGHSRSQFNVLISLCGLRPLLARSSLLLSAVSDRSLARSLQPRLAEPLFPHKTVRAIV